MTAANTPLNALMSSPNYAALAIEALAEIKAKMTATEKKGKSK